MTTLTTNWAPISRLPIASVTCNKNHSKEKSLLYSKPSILQKPYSQHWPPFFLLGYVHVKHDTSGSLNQFLWNSHGWCRCTEGWTWLFWETIGPIEPQILGKMCPKTSFSGFSQTVWGYLRKKLKNFIRYSISPQKVTFIFVVRRPIPSKMVMLPQV